MSPEEFRKAGNPESANGSDFEKTVILNNIDVVKSECNKSDLLTIAEKNDIGTTLEGAKLLQDSRGNTSEARGAVISRMAVSNATYQINTAKRIQNSIDRADKNHADNVNRINAISEQLKHDHMAVQEQICNIRDTVASLEEKLDTNIERLDGKISGVGDKMDDVAKKLESLDLGIQPLSAEIKQKHQKQEQREKKIGGIRDILTSKMTLTVGGLVVILFFLALCNPYFADNFVKILPFFKSLFER